MRILVVEDEVKIAAAIKRGLTQQSYAVDIAHTSDDAIAMAESEPYDLIILDRMLPGKTDGIGVIKYLRSVSNYTPILMLTAKDKVLDRAEGLNAGADDYLVKPFAFVELIARVRALLRRPSRSVGIKLKYKDIVLDADGFRVTRAGKNVELTLKEFALLEYFMRNQGTVISKDKIMQSVWDYDADILPNTVEVYVGYLRNKLEKPFKGAKLFHTKRGFGYIFGETK